jgi:hypothetical protein
MSSFYGVLGVCLTIFNNAAAEYLLKLSVGSVASTFLMWIIIDPIVGLLEMLLPSSRKERRIRIRNTQELRKKQYEKRQNILQEINRNSQYDRLRWQQILESDANELARLISNSRVNDKKTETKVIELGVKAFRIGGIECMRHLYLMTRQICERRMQIVPNLDYISIWWDGIGSWRCKWMEIESSQ